MLVGDERFPLWDCGQDWAGLHMYYYLYLSIQITYAYGQSPAAPVSFSQCLVCLDIYPPEILTCLKFSPCIHSSTHSMLPRHIHYSGCPNFPSFFPLPKSSTWVSPLPRSFLCAIPPSLLPAPMISCACEYPNTFQVLFVYLHPPWSVRSSQGQELCPSSSLQ